MYDSHVTMAAVATRVELGRQGMMVTREQAAAIFRDAAAMWAEERRDFEADADRAEYERMVEM
jgi:hypothetical protein